MVAALTLRPAPPSTSPAHPPSPAHLQDDDEKEIEIGHSTELLVQVQRQEGEEVVFGSVDGVALEQEPSVAMQCCPGAGAPEPAPPTAPRGVRSINKAYTKPILNALQASIY